MERRRTVLVAAAACLAVALACTSSKTPATPVAPTASSAASASDGSTLKVNAPANLSPANDTKTADASPTLTASGVGAVYTTDGAAFQYDFEVYDSNSIKVSTQVVSSPSYTLPIKLDANRRYTWRVRAAVPSLSAYGPWSPFASFVTPDNSGYLRGNELFDPLIDGKTVGRPFDVTFVPGVGVRLNSIESYVEYRLETPLTDGEYSVIITNIGNTNDPLKTKVMSMLQGDGVNITDNAYRFTLDRRNSSTGGVVRYTLRSRGVDAGEFNGGGASWNKSTIYFWQYTWNNGRSNVVVKEGGVFGGLMKNFGGNYKAPYAPNPHLVRLGSVLGRGGSESLPGATFRNVWVSGNPRPTGLQGDTP